MSVAKLSKSDSSVLINGLSTGFEEGLMGIDREMVIECWCWIGAVLMTMMIMTIISNFIAIFIIFVATSFVGTTSFIFLPYY